MEPLGTDGSPRLRYAALTPDEREVAVKIARMLLGRPVPVWTTAEDNCRSATQRAASLASDGDLPPA